MSSRVAEQVVREMVGEVLVAGHGNVSAVKAMWAERLGVSLATVERHVAASVGRRRKRRSDARCVDPALSELVREVAVAKFAVEERAGRQVGTETVMGAMGAAGVELGGVTAEAANRALRVAGVTRKQRVTRMEPGRANQVHVTDGSGSEYFFAMEQLGDGDWVLGIRTMAEKETKNPRRAVEDGKRLLVYYYATVDGFSRAARVWVTVATSENAVDHALALEEAWRGREAGGLRGLPERLFTDNGPLGGNPAGWALCEALGVELVTAMPNNAKAKGKVERLWRTMWSQFEAPFLLREEKTIRLSEVREALEGWLADYNGRLSPSQYAVGRSRAGMYGEGLAEVGVRELPAGDILTALASEWTATVDSAGRVRRDNIYYEVVELDEAMLLTKCRARRNVYGEVEVFNVRTGVWMGTRAFRAVDDGEYRGRKKTVSDEIAEEAKGFRVERSQWEGRSEGGNLVSISAAREERREREAEPVVFGSVDAAMGYFAEVLGVPLGRLPEDVVVKLREQIAGDLSEERIRKFAENIAGEAKR